MTANRSSLLSIATAAALALAVCARIDTADAHGDAGGGGNASSVSARSSLPPDLHMPSSAYTIDDVEENTTSNLHTGKSVPTLVREYNSAMHAAGWQGTMAL